MTAATALIGHSRRHIDLFLTASALCPRMRTRRPQTRTTSGETMTLAPARTLGTPGIDRFTPAQLLRTARLFASDPALATLLDPGSGDRQWAELDSTAYLQVWLIAWPAGTDTGWHDHGDAAGAFVTMRAPCASRPGPAAGRQERDLDRGRGPGLRPPSRAPRRQHRPGGRPVGARLRATADPDGPVPTDGRRPSPYRRRAGGGRLVTALTTAPLRADDLWETSLFSSRPGTGRGWEAPTYDGIDDQLDDARSRLTRLTRAGGVPGGAVRAGGAGRHPTGRPSASRRARSTPGCVPW